MEGFLLKKKQLQTDMIHEAYDANEHLGSISIPIFQTSTFEMETFEKGMNLFAGKEEGYTYSRLQNPTVEILEKRMATLESAEAGLAFSSGMGAISAVLMHVLKANDHLICSASLYGSTYSLLELLQEKMNITVEFTNFSSQEELSKMIQSNTSCIYIETPVNPTMEIYDLEMIAQIAHTHNIPTVVDNTF